MGIVEVAPAADKEEDGMGRQWDQRAEVMRDSIIYLRNNPSILFWEAGNTGVTGPQMEQMVALRKELGVSIITRGREWEQTPSGAVTSTVTNDRERAEVARGRLRRIGGRASCADGSLRAGLVQSARMHGSAKSCCSAGFLRADESCRGYQPLGPCASVARIGKAIGTVYGHGARDFGAGCASGDE
jgi:hypothetical protein